jgi:hypothetical protein
MALKLDRGIRRVTVVKSADGETGRHEYRSSREDDDERQPVKRVTVVRRDGSGQILSRESYSAERGSKRSSRSLRPIERGVRDLLEFQSRVLQSYLGRHRRSNEKRRDGWLVDMPRNVTRAVRAAKPRKLFRMRSLTRED